MNDLMPEWITMQDTLKIKRAGDCGAARIIMRLAHRDQSATQIELALQAALGDAYEIPKPVLRTRDPYVGIYQTVAYMLGATLGQIATTSNISREGVWAAAVRRFPDKDYRNARRKRHHFTLEGVGVIKNMFYSLLRADPEIAREDVMTIVNLIEGEIQMDEEVAHAE